MSDGNALPFDPTRKPDLDKPGPRVPLSKFDFAVKFLEQQGRCYLCNGKLVRGQIIDEHDPPRETMPAAICDNLEFRKLACRVCAKAKTVADQGLIAKGRRVRGEKGQRARRAKNGPQLVSRSTFPTQRPLLSLPQSMKPDKAVNGGDNWPKRKLQGRKFRSSTRSKATQS